LVLESLRAYDRADLTIDFSFWLGTGHIKGCQVLNLQIDLSMIESSLACFYHPERAEYLAGLNCLMMYYRFQRDRLFHIAQPAFRDRNRYITDMVKNALDELRYDLHWNQQVLHTAYMAKVQEERKRRRLAAKGHKFKIASLKDTRATFYEWKAYLRDKRRWDYQAFGERMLLDHYEEFDDYYNEGCTRV
jgi:hypothetical protein